MFVYNTAAHNDSAAVAVRLVTDDSKVTLFPLGQWDLCNQHYIKYNSYKLSSSDADRN